MFPDKRSWNSIARFSSSLMCTCPIWKHKCSEIMWHLWNCQFRDCHFRKETDMKLTKVYPCLRNLFTFNIYAGVRRDHPSCKERGIGVG
jgi:hypothetical protein